MKDTRKVLNADGKSQKTQAEIKHTQTHEEVKRDSPNPKMENKHEDDQRNFKVKKKVEVSDNHFSEEAQSGSFTDWDQVFGEIEKVFSGHLECGQEQIRGVESG